MGGTTAIVLATGNAGKAREFARLLGGAFEVLPLPDTVGLPPEDGSTFAENARLKAQAVFESLGRRAAVLADDSGLEVTALAGRPGVHSARYAGEGATDAQNVAKLLAEMSGAADRSARFVCCLCLMRPGAPMEGGGAETAPRVVEVRGVTQGRITESPRGTDGFGYDPVFEPLGWSFTLAEAPPEDKDLVSHRGAAARALLERLAEEGGG